MCAFKIAFCLVTCFLLRTDAVVQYWPLNTTQINTVTGSTTGLISGNVHDSQWTAVNVQGQGSYIDLGDFSQQCISDPSLCSSGFSVSLWVWVNSSVSEKQTILLSGEEDEGRTTNSPGMYLKAMVASEYYKKWTYWVGTKDKHFKVQANLVSDEWSFVTLTWSSSTGSVFYVNGTKLDESLIGVDKIGYYSQNNITNLTVGESGNIDSNFMISELTISDEVYDDGKVLNVFNSASPPQLLPLVLLPSPSISLPTSTQSSLTLQMSLSAAGSPSTTQTLQTTETSESGSVKQSTIVKPPVKECVINNMWRLNGEECYTESIFNLSKKLDALSKQSLELQHVLPLTEQLKLITSNSTLETSDILLVSDMLDKMNNESILKQNASEMQDFIKNFVEVSSNLIEKHYESKWKDIQQEIPGTSQLVHILETFVGSIPPNATVNTSTSYITNNIYLQVSSYMPNNASFEGLELPVNENITFESTISEWYKSTKVRLPTEVCKSVEENEVCKISLIIYKTLNEIYPQMFHDHTTKIRTDIASHLTSLVVSPELKGSLKDPIIFELKIHETKKPDKQTLCGFWNYSIPGYVDGAWSTHGCQVEQVNNSYVSCSCDHLTTFAILMQVQDVEISPEHHRALLLITYIGTGFSLLAEFLSLLAFTVLAKPSQERVMHHINLVSCLGIAQILFLTGIENAAGVPLACKTVAIVLHFCYLSVFMWMLAEGIHLYFKIIRVFDEIKVEKFTFIYAFGVPLFIVVITALLEPDGYGTPTYCWLSMNHRAIWAFVSPVLVIMMVNLVILMLVIRSMSQAKLMKKRTELQRFRSAVRAVVVLLPLLGLTWLFGLLSFNKDTIIFQYLFTIFNSLQGLFIFFSQCVMDEQIRTSFKIKVLKMRPMVSSSATNSGNPNITKNDTKSTKQVSNTKKSTTGQHSLRPLKQTKRFSQTSRKFSPVEETVLGE